ncbi:MAG TPA: hypothetical protein VG052_04530, partial [Puia sp.]|nr:hypothetical protein [Puia sp.]
KKPGTRVVDKLVKVFLRNGGERWMLLHVEVQGKNEKGFAERMFRYYYRILDRHDRDVAAISILTGRDGKNVPEKYERLCLWGRALYEYKTLCITDYTDEALSASNNPFAIVLLVAKEALLKLKGSEEEIDAILLEHKLMIVTLLQGKGIFGERKINAIMAFLKNYVRFKKPETNRIFRGQVDQKTGKKNTMGIIEQLAEIKAEEVRKEGKQESVRLFLANTEFSMSKIANLVGVSIYFVKKVKESLRPKLQTK